MTNKKHTNSVFSVISEITKEFKRVNNGVKIERHMKKERLHSLVSITSLIVSETELDEYSILRIITGG